MRQIFKYVIIQFLPYTETGEFANIGVLVFSVKTGFFDFKLTPQRFKRIPHFFDKLDKNFYKNVISLFNEELANMQSMVKNLSGQDLLTYMENRLAFKESVVRFGNIRTIAMESNQDITDKLYNRYVMRDFIAPKQHREKCMVKLLRTQLIEQKLDGIYKQKEIKTGLRVVNLPFVAHFNQYGKTRIIKPMAFIQQKPTLLIEHGERWLNRFNWLIKANKIEAKNILLPIEPPKKQGDLQQAYLEVINEIKNIKIKVIKFENKKEIFHFAETALEQNNNRGFISPTI